MNEESELLRRYVKEKSQEAFADLVRRHLGLVYHTALRCLDGNTHAAEEVAQTVFTDLARKAPNLVRHEVLAGWLHTSARYAALRHRRKEQRRRIHEMEVHTMQPLAQDPNAAAQWERLRPVIDDALHGLSERDRAAVLLRFFEGKTFADMATVLGLTEDGARLRVSRALDKLQPLLARRGITSATGALALALTGQAALAAPFGLASSVTTSALEQASASGGATLSVGVLSLMKATSLILAASLAANVGIAWQLFATEPGASQRFAARPNVPPAPVALPEFNPTGEKLTDAMEIARRLKAEGFSDDVLKWGVTGAVAAEYRDFNAQRNAALAARRTRWNPNPIESVEAATGLKPPQRQSGEWERTMAIWTGVGLDASGRPVASRYRNLTPVKAAQVERLERDYEEIRQLGFSAGGMMPASVSAEIASAFEADLLATLTPAEATDYFRYSSEVGRKVAKILAPLSVGDDVHATIADAELEADRLNRSTRDRAVRNARTLAVLQTYRSTLGDERFLTVIGKMPTGEQFLQVDALYREAGLTVATRANLYFTAVGAAVELSAAPPAAHGAIVERTRTALTVGAGLHPDQMTAFESTTLAQKLKRAALGDP